MSDISEAGLAKRVEELSAENASLKAENRDRRIRNKAATTELEDLRAQVKLVETERDGFKTTATALPGEKDATIASLTGKLLARDHRDAFAAVKDFDGVVDPKTGKTPKYKLADGVTIDALWQLSQYKAEGATPDAQAVTTKLGEAAKAHPFLFATVDTAADAAARSIAVSAREGGPGVDKGASSATLLASSTDSAVRPARGYVEGRI
jgi:hypothetical protein